MNDEYDFHQVSVFSLFDRTRAGELWELQLSDKFQGSWTTPFATKGEGWGAVPGRALVIARRMKPNLTTEQKYDKLVAGLKADRANPVSAQLLSDVGEA